MLAGKSSRAIRNPPGSFHTSEGAPFFWAATLHSLSTLQSLSTLLNRHMTREPCLASPPSGHCHTQSTGDWSQRALETFVLSCL